MKRLLLVILLLTLTACASSSQRVPGGTRDDLNAAAVQAVVDELRRGEDVVEVTGGYARTEPGYGEVAINVTVPDGTPVEEQEAVLDRAEQLVWRSPVEPLSAVSLVVIEPGAAPQEPARQRSYIGERQVAQLEQKYGER